jgi:cysteine desulfurase/selenocysteine lyase
MISHSSDSLISPIRAEFPILSTKVHDKPLIYLDNAATTQKPTSVIQAIQTYYQCQNANVHRGIHYLSEVATEAYEQARLSVQAHIHAESKEEIIFVRGTTEAINLVANTFGRIHFKPGDEVLITEMEHHANIVPWQIISESTGIALKVVPINDDGEISLTDVKSMLSDKTKLVAITHISNAIGSINPIKAIIDLAHTHQVPVLIDGAQAAPHTAINVKELDCDFYAFSAHKMYGPTGIGVLYAKKNILETLPPYQGGGEMIANVRFDKTTYNVLPHKFEAGTPHIAGAIGLAAAIRFLQNIGLNNIQAHEDALTNYALDALSNLKELKILGPKGKRGPIISFVHNSIHPHDIGTILNDEGIAVRAGHHCAMPLMKRMNVPATVRASFAPYNTFQDIDQLIIALEKVERMFT